MECETQEFKFEEIQINHNMNLNENRIFLFMFEGLSQIQLILFDLTEMKIEFDFRRVL